MPLQGRNGPKVSQIDSTKRPDSGSRLLEFRKQVLARVLGRQHEEFPIVPSEPILQATTEARPQCRDVPVSYFFGQTEELKSQDQVVGPENHLHIGSIGPEAASGESWRLHRNP